MDDEKGCEMHVHITDVENLKIEVGLRLKMGYVLRDALFFFSNTQESCVSLY